MEGTLRVTPEKLISTAEQFSDSATTVQSLTASMLETIDALKSSWAGEAEIAYNNKAHSLQDSINKMVRMIQEHSTDLTTMAQYYQEAEQAAQEVAASLKTDVIV